MTFVHILRCRAAIFFSIFTDVEIPFIQEHGLVVVSNNVIYISISNDFKCFEITLTAFWHSTEELFRLRNPCGRS